MNMRSSCHYHLKEYPYLRQGIQGQLRIKHRFPPSRFVYEATDSSGL